VTSEETRPAENHQVGGGGSTVLTGDFHANSWRWDPRCTEWREDSYWEEIVNQHRLGIGNDDWPTHYWTRNESKGVSIIDLTLPNQPLRKWTIWDGNHPTGSDHENIECEVDMARQEKAGGPQVVGWNLAAILQEDQEQAEKLWREWARGRAYLGVESTGDDVKSKAVWCQESLGNVLDTTAEKITICTRSKRCWNGEIKERWSQLGREKRRRRRSAATAQSNARLQKWIWRAKDGMWNDCLIHMIGAGVWSEAKFAILQAGATVEALTDRDGNQPNTITERKEMLRRESFPQDEQDQYFELPQAGQVHQSVTEQAVERALFVHSIGIAPAPDKVSFWSCTPSLCVAEKANLGTSEGRCPNKPTPSWVEAGRWCHNLQARKGRLHNTQGGLLHFTTKLHGESCRKSGCRATGWRGWEKRTA